MKAPRKLERFYCDMSKLKLQYGPLIEAGCDEAGRGCLAGPVVAAAVILPKKFKAPALNDSKKLSEKKREQLREQIEGEALAYAVSFVYPPEIDEINILQASFTAMHRAVEQLSVRPEFLAIDGNRFRPYPEIEHVCVIKGDGKYANIAAASILAKTYRDAYMKKVALEFPEYQWEKNKGYPTAAHRKAIEIYGSCSLHRKSFTLLPQLKLPI